MHLTGQMSTEDKDKQRNTTRAVMGGILALWVHMGGGLIETRGQGRTL